MFEANGVKSAVVRWEEEKPVEPGPFGRLAHIPSPPANLFFSNRPNQLLQV